jgi:glycosyltransferase involved in cell wall biosynthesis
MKAVFLTAGAAGMYCGSCMHDNALARAMRDQGVDCLLQPVYTPIRTDGVSMAGESIFFGGIHIYLLQRWPWVRRIPVRLRRLLDWSPLIQLATRRAHATDAAQLSQLTISMLKGTEGAQAEEVDRLVHWLADQIKPDAIVLSNLLIGGSLPAIRRALPDSRLVVLLQGDDIFLDHLPAEPRREVIGLCRQLVADVDCFVVNSRFYADKMGAIFQIPDEKIEVTPLSIDTKPFQNGPLESTSANDGSFRLGYFARVAPEKGLHHLVDAFVALASKPQHDDLTLHVAGWLGESNHAYLESQRHKLDQAGLSDRFVYHGSPDLDEKVQFLRSLDALCVPTDYEDPKGLFVLESLAAGVPVVQPNHGAFGELIESTGGGLLVEPGSVEELCQAIEKLKTDDELRIRLGREGSQHVHANHNIEQAAQEIKQILFD